ncbi:MAG: hypothetical protein IKB86_03300 [Clostridia bacterium]|nr:hypothetical protein [Clostridia bacterium]MBR6633306.1 hypothetical protein [Clostridia bacterium]
MSENVKVKTTEAGSLSYYEAEQNTTLRDVAQAVGVPYEDLVVLNPYFSNGRVRKGQRVIVAINLDEEVKFMKDEKEALIKKNHYDDNIKTHQQEYDNNVASAKKEHSEKVESLNEKNKQDTINLEGDMAKRKLSFSSIAKNEMNALKASKEKNKASLDKDLDTKLKKLKFTLNKKVMGENQKKDLL